MKKNNLKQIIADDLIQLLRNNSSIQQISSWAEGVYSLYCREFDPETEEVINRIAFMTNGPEFHLTKNELENLAKHLINK